jgi:hypothetical protein
MNGRGGIARGLVVVALVILLIGLGVRSLVTRTVDRATRSAEMHEGPVPIDDADTPTAVTPSEPPVAPAVRTEGTTTPSAPPTTSTPTPPSPTPAELDDPRRTPFAPGTTPIEPPPYDPTAPVPHRGSLPPMVIRDVVREMLPELRFCFEWQLREHPELHGRVTMEFTIAEDGSVTEPTLVEDSLGDETVGRCFTHVMSSLHFPPPDGGGSVLVRYPFTLDGAPEARRPEGI